MRNFELIYGEVDNVLGKFSGTVLFFSRGTLLCAENVSEGDLMGYIFFVTNEFLSDMFFCSPRESALRAFPMLRC